MKLAGLDISVLRIPTDRPESDGTFEWNSTTVVLAQIRADDGNRGMGWSYASAAAGVVIDDTLRPAIADLPLEDIGRAWSTMVASVRNVGRGGVAAMAISAVDIALWDLKGRAEGRPVYRLLGPHRDSVPIYGSGGFTSYTMEELVDQLSGWVASGFPRVKMKIGTGWGTRLDVDRSRIVAVRQAIGPDAELFIDANGAYTPKQAMRLAHDVDGIATYFEEPVSSDHLEDLAMIRREISQDVAAGEYGWDPWYFRKMLNAGAVDVMQADATRCLGITGFLIAADLAYSAGVAFSAHCSPTIHAHAACAAPQISHVEYFHDHARIEQLLFDGAPKPEAGTLRPAPDRAGLGLELKHADLDAYRAA
ncbi:MAG: enolase C-terminal domain-like protein [Candidatus Dormibacteraceae bacterium]